MTPFGKLFLDHMEYAGFSRNVFAQKVGVSVAQIARIVKGERTPQLELVSQWADALGLKGAKREQFLELAELAHAPERVARRYLAMQERLRALEERIGKLERG